MAVVVGYVPTAEELAGMWFWPWLTAGDSFRCTSRRLPERSGTPSGARCAGARPDQRWADGACSAAAPTPYNRSLQLTKVDWIS